MSLNEKKSSANTPAHSDAMQNRDNDHSMSEKRKMAAVFRANSAGDMHYTPTEEDFALFTVVDGNQDGYTFSYQDTRDNMYASYQGQFISTGGGGSTAQDDWLFFPAVEIEDIGKFREVTFDICLSSSWGSGAAFEVFAGTAPDPSAMTIPVLGQTGVSSEDFVTYSDIFRVPAAGKYYVGIHNISESNSYGFFLRELGISESERSASGPVPVENLAIVPSEKERFPLRSHLRCPKRTPRAILLMPMPQ